jgi:L-seryl-tRNA(Ser) seleniumtransferase
MITADVADVRARARVLAERLFARGIGCEVVETEASIGGGAFPTARIASAGVALSSNPERLDMRLRAEEPPVVARIQEGRVVLDLRTVPPAAEDELAAIIQRAIV